MTTMAGEPVAVEATGVHVTRRAGEIVVAVLGEPSHRTASVLSCRLHEAVAGAEEGLVLTVDLGAAVPAEPAIDRVLHCARESAAAHGLAFRVL